MNDWLTAAEAIPNPKSNTPDIYVYVYIYVYIYISITVSHEKAIRNPKSVALNEMSPSWPLGFAALRYSHMYGSAFFYQKRRG